MAWAPGRRRSFSPPCEGVVRGGDGYAPDSGPAHEDAKATDRAGSTPPNPPFARGGKLGGGIGGNAQLFSSPLFSSPRQPLRILALGLLVALSAAGCVGPRSLELPRLRYDQAVQETSEQQWLRNIVRIRYGDLPSILDVSAITSQFELSSQGNFTTGLERASPNLSNYGSLGLNFRDAPTLSYTPRDPAELTRAMVAPVGITALGLMANTGWSVEDVLRVMVAEANGLPNVPGAEQIVPTDVPPMTPFVEMARLADVLRRERTIALVSVEAPQVLSPPIATNRVDGSDVVLAANNKLEFRPSSDANALVLTRPESAYKIAMSPAAQGRPEVEHLRALLHLSPGGREYGVRRVDQAKGRELLPLPEDRESVDIHTRTLLEMLTVLSKGVQVPADHACRGLAAQTVGPDGVVFDWTQVTQGLFHVCVQKKRPKDAALAIEYQGYWFFIPPDDKRSKSTLALIQTLFNLQLSEPKKSAPLLTLPVGL